MEKPFHDSSLQVISRLKLALSRSREELSMFYDTMESACCAFAITDVDGNLVFLNKYAKLLMGVSGFESVKSGSKAECRNTNDTSNSKVSNGADACPDMANKNEGDDEQEHSFYTKKDSNNNIAIWEVLPESPVRDTVKQMIQGDMFDQIKGETYPCECKNVGMKYVLLTIFPHMRKRVLEGWIVIIQDHTGQELVNQQKRRSEHIDSVTKLVGSIAHEFKNPLGAISIHLQLLEKNLKKLDSSLLEDKIYNNMLNNIKIIEEEIENMNNVMGLFLNNLKLDPSELVVQNLNKLVDVFVEFISPKLQEDNIKCTVVLEKNLPDVRASKPSITHVLLNLVKNSIEAFEGDSGEVTIRTYSKESRVYLSVTDTGKGIQSGQQNKIFDPYVSTKEYGSGIGLAISDKIMKMHRGNIILDTVYKDGARFVLDFPRVADAKHMIGGATVGKSKVARKVQSE